ncbi:MAG TPA: hypothetical protein VK750_03180 [Cytophagaceae bacterium]|jgi:hypothetical protein|nr:hypothetical protein [Cytophagaceae bacterium]
MSRLHLSIFILILLLCGQVNEAWCNPKDSLIKKTDSLVTTKTFRKFLLNLDTRGSLVHNVPVTIGGLKIGIQLHKRHRFGLGVYMIGMPIFGYMLFKPATYDVNNISHKDVVVRNKPVSTNTTESDNTVSLSMIYGTVFYEYVLLTHKRWEISIPLQLGFGQAEYMSTVLATTTNPVTHADKTNSFNRPNEYEFIFLGETSLNVQFKIFCWMGLGGGIGYRRLFNDDNNPKLVNTFDNVIWIAKVKLFPADLIKVIKGTQKWHRVY